jgi:hypothetical protein
MMLIFLIVIVASIAITIGVIGELVNIRVSGGEL